MKRWIPILVVLTCLATRSTVAATSFAEFDKKGKSGERLNVVFFGSSLTWGANASDPQLSSYRALLAQRPADGYGSLVAFWALPALSGFSPDLEVTQQTVLKTRWFGVDIAVAMGSTDLHERALIDAGGNVPLLVRRTWDSGA